MGMYIWFKPTEASAKKNLVIFKLISDVDNFKYKTKITSYWTAVCKFSGSQDPLPEVEEIFIYILNFSFE